MRLIKAMVATLAGAALALGAMVGVANADVVPNQVTGVIEGADGVGLASPWIYLCSVDCTYATYPGYMDPTLADKWIEPNADGSFASTINPAILPTGTYKIAIDDLSSQGTAALGGGNRNYLTFDGGYLKLAADGAYTITTSFSSGTSFNIDAAGTDLGTIKLAPFVTPTSNPAGITIASGSTNFCPNYSVKPTIPKFASGVTVKVTAYSTTSSKFSSTGTVANQKAVWSTSYAATGATKTVSYTPPSSLAGKYLVFGVTGSKTNATSWTVLYSPPLKIYNNVCKVSTGWVKAWSKKSGGTLKAGRKVAISATTFKQSGMKATYKWLVNGKAVKNGTGRTLALKSTWGGKTLKVQISVTRAGNKTITKTITLGKIAY